MCVIAVVEDNDKRPTEAEITAMWKQNPQGGGVAWREGGKVHWRKGLMTLEAMQDFLRRVTTPYIAHFRVSSCGDGGIPSLTHPFLVHPESPLLLEGSTEGQLLFHNGHWSNWTWDCKSWITAAAGRIKIPQGKWSDSRALAFWVHHYGVGILEGKPFDINEKIVLFGPGEDDLDFFGPKDAWSVYHGYIVSNEYWLRGIKEPHIVAAAKSEGKITAETSMFMSPPGTDMKRREVLGLTGGTSTPTTDSATLVRGAEVSSKPHPFVRAKEEYETAILAYTTLDPANGKRLGSKTQMKKKRKAFEDACWKYKDKYQEWKEQNRLAVIGAAERLLEKSLQEVENSLPN